MSYPPKSFRIDPVKLKALEKKGLNVADIVKKAIDSALKKCPTCGKTDH
jgi:hypothetical protein